MSKNIFTSFIIILFTLINSSIIGIVFNDYRNSNSLKELQINSLISEIGELKQDNQKLNETINIQNEQLIRNNEAISFLNDGFESSINQIEAKNNLINQLEIKNKLETEQIIKNYSKKLTEQEEKLKEIEIQKIFELKDQNLETILLLGSNEGLTDTIMLCVINKENNKITLISIPRDLFHKGRKINEYYSKFGIETFKSEISDITGLNVSKYININFKGVSDFIDSIEGLDIEVKKDITDYSYPTSNGGYRIVKFKKGIERMDGERILEYARSRKSTSDYDRADRQQQILIAIKEKIKSSGLTKNLSFYQNIYDLISKNLTTDLNFLDIAIKFEEYKNYSASIGNVLSSSNLLSASKSTNGQFILIPDSNKYLEIKSKILEII